VPGIGNQSHRNSLAKQILFQPAGGFFEAVATRLGVFSGFGETRCRYQASLATGLQPELRRAGAGPLGGEDAAEVTREELLEALRRVEERLEDLSEEVEGLREAVEGGGG
jgi:hypothetical protein